MRFLSAHLRVDRCFFPTPTPAAAPADRIGAPRATSCSRPITSQSMQTRAAVPSASLTGSISTMQKRQHQSLVIGVPSDSRMHNDESAAQKEQPPAQTPKRAVANHVLHCGPMKLEA